MRPITRSCRERPSRFQDALAAEGFTGLLFLRDPSPDRRFGDVADGHGGSHLQDEFAVLFFGEDERIFHTVKAELPAVGRGKRDRASFGYGKDLGHAAIMHCRIAVVKFTRPIPVWHWYVVG